MIRAVMFVWSAELSRRSFASGNSGVRSSNRGRWRISSGSAPFTVRICRSAGFFSLRPAMRDSPVTWSPLRSPYCRVCLTDT